MNSNLNDVAAEALEIFRVKLSGAVVDDSRLYACRKQLVEAAVLNDPYPIERLGDYLAHSQHLIAQVKLPLTEEAQAELYERMEQWCRRRLDEAAKRAGRNDARNETQLVGQGAVASSGNGLKKRGKR